MPVSTKDYSCGAQMSPAAETSYELSNTIIIHAIAEFGLVTLPPHGCRWAWEFSMPTQRRRWDGMKESLRYRVLGPLRVQVNGRWRSVTQPKPAMVLGCLLLHANVALSVDRLADEVWGMEQPNRADASLQAYVSRLRQLLPTDEKGASVLRSSSAGYILTVKPGELDSQLFDELVFRGRMAAQQREHTRAEDTLVEALSLWDGPILGAVSGGPMIASMEEVLNEALMECMELRTEVGFQLGRHRQLIGMLRRVTTERPLHEGFWALLMQALWHSGRRADALAAFQNARSVLNRELGLEPSMMLQKLQSDILEDGLAIGDRSHSEVHHRAS
jgi:SARP family transcriptional regulator, regulator of embCAB operon